MIRCKGEFMPQTGGSGSKEIDIFKQILQFMMKKSEYCWSRRIDISGEKLRSETYDNYRILIKRMSPSKWGNLDPLISKTCKSKVKLVATDVGHVYFPPFYGDDREFVPILTFEADFSGELPQFLFRIAMLAYNRDNWKLRVFGCRFETPHANSSHDYCHAQFTRDPLGMSASGKSELIEMMADWSPENIPCILGPARGPASLLVWLIVDLYGKKSAPLFSIMNFDKVYKEPLRYLST